MFRRVALKPTHDFHALRRQVNAVKGRPRIGEVAWAKRGFASKDGGVERLAVQHMVDQFRKWGHYEAKLDPLGIKHPTIRFELTKEQFAPLFQMQGEIDATALKHFPNKKATAIEIYNHLQASYCDKIGAEFEYIEEPMEREWFCHKLERIAGTPKISPSEIKNSFKQMKMAEVFEDFMAKKFSSFKRYSGEGVESLMPALDTILSSAAKHHVEEVVVGMPHRGRLAFLVSLLDYPAHKLFHKVRGNTDFPAGYTGIDDVTSHIGHTVVKKYEHQDVKVSLLHNPSHLEIINPVANGKVRAKIDDGSKAMTLLMHGDAAFSGQGCVPEGLSLSNLKGYSVGGTVHLIVNNQIGFTTTYPDGRFSRYSSDFAKAINAPVLHVNGESIPHVIEACKIAVEYRNTFNKDIIIDLFGFRRHGHNEVDEPSFTQPEMYGKIRALRSFPQRYGDYLIENGTLSTQKIDQYVLQLQNHLEKELVKSQAYKPSNLQAFEGKWQSMGQAIGNSLYEAVDTGVNVDSLVRYGLESVTVPTSVEVHERLQRTHIKARKDLLMKAKEEILVDWATAEAMAFGSLLDEGYNVRMSGQDSIRGTFSQRHQGLTDQKTGEIYFPLHATSDNGKLSIINSNLSELAVMAFEYGYSWEDPKNLVLWEAQFGDFFNGAQIVIDQFISSSESKWMRQSGMVILLPHGYDGAGPDHSSGKYERFLQLCDSQGVGPRKKGVGFEQYIRDVNMSVVNPTTPANYFHLLRRQQLRKYRKPVIVMAPKTLLRAPFAQSALQEMGPGTSFQSVIGDIACSSSKIVSKDVKRILFCSGKVYYDLVNARQSHGDLSTAIIRVEEMCPFPYHAISAELQRYAHAKDYVWVQEEPLNQGAWSYVRPHMEKCFKKADTRLKYIGREALPASATGLSKAHQHQLQSFLAQAFPPSSVPKNSE